MAQMRARKPTPRPVRDEEVTRLAKHALESVTAFEWYGASCEGTLMADHLNTAMSLYKKAFGWANTLAFTRRTVTAFQEQLELTHPK